MFIISAKFTKKRLMLCVIALALLIWGAVALGGRQEAPADPIPGETDQQRTAYLASLGWITSSAPTETLEFTLPDPLGETYQRYNQLQQEQGFDLTPYAGQQVKRFTYQVTNHPQGTEDVQADLYVCGGLIIGGDILCTGEESFVATLKFPN